MEQVDFDKVDKSNEEKPREPAMKEKVDEIYTALKDTNKKKIKIPRKAKTRKRQQKQGYIGAIYFDENGTVRGEKVKVQGGSFAEKKEIKYHATDVSEIYFWEGKFPVIFQPTWRMNPINPRKFVREVKDESGNLRYIVNETYGHKFIMAKMLSDAIKIKNKGGGMSIFLIIALIIGGYIAYTTFFGG